MSTSDYPSQSTPIFRTSLSMLFSKIPSSPCPAPEGLSPAAALGPAPSRSFASLSDTCEAGEKLLPCKFLSSPSNGSRSEDEEIPDGEREPERDRQTEAEAEAAPDAESKVEELGMDEIDKTDGQGRIDSYEGAGMLQSLLSGSESGMVACDPDSWAV